ncbi:GNAT family N-acetyltransferase [Cohnella sp. JJ-181]|uniref:GNAT family N-acetyltransferase n=1 Tax=Cohnella rhizoplanae TaxID=2974897 RepID=UPI0022FF9AB0|nr:GNAT family N-acetyltransferase [Cohnella sp. JJ-181]CAI6087054.1 hypothetical protein COHCIP112018_05308 [Cohnella sp. JJ-181]
MISFAEMKLEDSYRIREIDRSEKIELTYKCINRKIQEIKMPHECPNWDEAHYQEIIKRYDYELRNGGTAYGAYDGDKLVGFGVLAHKFRGKDKSQLHLDLMYVSRIYRRQGIGSRIFHELSQVAIERGATQLYISATETESAVKFYFSLGSALTSQLDEELFRKEPNDIHMTRGLL